MAIRTYQPRCPPPFWPNLAKSSQKQGGDSRGLDLERAAGAKMLAIWERFPLENTQKGQFFSRLRRAKNYPNYFTITE